jgi:N-acetylglucosamine-6-phosphate deacetylase
VGLGPPPGGQDQGGQRRLSSASLSAGSVLLPEGRLVPARVSIEEGRIASVDPQADAPGGFIVPGFIDLQVNGHDDIDVAEARDGDWERLDALLLAQGVTAWCPTLVTAPLESYRGPLSRVAEAAARPEGRPRILGAHLEGPFLGGMEGAHRTEWILPPDLAWISELPDVVRILTLGAEVPGAEEAIRVLRERGTVVSLGHSAATLEEAHRAIQAGATMATHLFNAMRPLHHRDPGLAAAALTDPRLVPTVISDGVHVHPTMVRLAFAARAGIGALGPALVTDAVAWRSGAVGGAGLVRQGADAPRRADGTIAGSALTMDRAVTNSVDFGVDPALALSAASAWPAEILGDQDRGRLSVGARADLVVLDRDFGVRSTWVGGREVWTAG